MIVNRVETNYECHCNETKSLKIIGTNILTLTNDCSVHSAAHDYFPEKHSKENVVKRNRLVEIDECCNNFKLNENKKMKCALINCLASIFMS